MPYRAIAAQALTAWRAAHARLEAATPDSAEWQDAYLEEQTAKAAYQDAVDAARREHLPEPPPFAEVAEAEETETEMTPPTVDGQLYGG